jgi:hypothetical protein
MVEINHGIAILERIFREFRGSSLNHQHLVFAGVYREKIQVGIDGRLRPELDPDRG